MSIIRASYVDVIVDDEDFEYLSQYTWYYHKSDGYIYRNLEHKRNSKRIQIHREIMLCPDDLVIDHINRNKLDNRKENLRVVEMSKNSQNRKIPSNNKSGYMGVWKQKNKWVAEIRKNNKKYYLGIFNSPEEAAIMYDSKAIEFGFLHRNFQ